MSEIESAKKEQKVLISNRYFALCWRLLLVVCSLVGIPCIFMVSAGFHPENQLYYFTMQTNFFVLFMFLFLVVKTIIQIAKEGKTGVVAHINESLQLFVTFGITVTFLGYVVLLTGMGFTMAGVGVSPAKQTMYEAGNWLVHIIVPFMCIADWVMFMPHGNVKNKSVAYWLIYPLIYMVILAIRATVTKDPVFVIASKNGVPVKSLYPYFFIAFENFEAWQTTLILIALVLFFILFALLYILIDKKIAKSIEKKHAK